jgi:hypothetical protein
MKGPIRPVYRRETKPVSTDDSNDQLRKLFDELAGNDWLKQNCTTIERGALAVLRQFKLPDSYPPIGVEYSDELVPPLAKLAYEVLVTARWIGNCREPSRDYLHNAILLGGMYERLRTESDLAELVELGRRAKEGGARGGAAKHLAQARTVAKRWAELESVARKLHGAGRDRSSILDALENLGSKLGVKRSTIEKHPCIRQHLPRARRKSDR